MSVPVTAAQIAEWAAKSEAQRELPRLVRKLMHGTATISSIAVPAGGSVSLPGFDGEVHSSTGSAWVPVGHSVWELSCQATIGKKANSDYNKRTEQHDAAIRSKRTFVAVTARRWTGKVSWRDEKSALGEWLDVRAYDAEDLEHWLEASPGVALWFAEQLGVDGPGVESIDRYWTKWASQCAPAITIDAIIADRSCTKGVFLDQLRKILEGKASESLAIRSDSVEEAVAFACATISGEHVSDATGVVVTDTSGWRYVEANDTISLAIAASPEVAERPVSRPGLAVVIPYAAGDMEEHFKGSGGGAEGAAIVLERPKRTEMRDALIRIGVDENDARRVAGQCGRSWTVYRRTFATNPAIRQPSWLTSPDADVLSVVCLVAGWMSTRTADQVLVSYISGLDYSALEAKLRRLARLPDAPVVQIGDVWKAKSPVELMRIFGSRITGAELDRFFGEAERVLSEPDPILELSADKRYAASIYGKERAHSGLLIRSLTDSLIKLAVRGSDSRELEALGIEGRVIGLVRSLLHDADETRWLSLASLLPALAEAAPDAFLRAVEQDLASPDAPVRALIKETGGTDLMSNRCWHSGLLWALEGIAWAPEHLARVALVLAKLTTTEVKGNWSNTPANTLLKLVSSWSPQTASPVEQRIKVLDRLIKTDPDAAYDLLDQLTDTGTRVAFPSHRPKWRDEDAGAGQGVTNRDYSQMMFGAIERQISMANGDAVRIARLIPKCRELTEELRTEVFELVKPFEAATAYDQDKEILQKPLRRLLVWHRKYDDKEATEVEAFLAPIQRAYDALRPRDVIVRHRWLFDDHYVELPIRGDNDTFDARGEAQRKARAEAIESIYSDHRWDGIKQLLVDSGRGWLIGNTLGHSEVSSEEIALWVQEGAEFEADAQIAELVGGYLGALPRDAAVDVCKGLVGDKALSGWSDSKKAKLLALAPEIAPVAQLATDLGSGVADDYWQSCRGQLWQQEDADHFDFVLEKLIQVGRPRSAMAIADFKLEHVSTDQLAAILEGIMRGEEADAAFPDHYTIRQAIKKLDTDANLDKQRVAGIQFGYITLFQFDDQDAVTSLLRMVMSDASAFVDVLKLIYRPKGSKPTEEPDAAQKDVAQRAWELIHICSVQPGVAADGHVDDERFVTFVEQARDLARDAGILEACESTLGEIMGRGPDGEDGIFPMVAARRVLDKPEHEVIRNGFYMGRYNSRGMTSRGPYSGGDQERDLEDRYAQQAEAIRLDYPIAAQALDDLAKSYRRDARRHDLDAEFSKDEE